MDYQRSEWNGYQCLDFVFEGRNAKLVCPKNACEGKKWLLKTEYFGAFPAFELEMLEKGYHLAYVSNQTRWHDASDDDKKAAFCEFLKREFGMHEKCVPVGMSCGGMHAVYFAAKYPEKIAGLYLDAPVLNLLSCPAGIGLAGDSDVVVPYVENGKALYEYFVEKGGDIALILKAGCDHHPHGLTDNTPLVEFAERVYQR